MLFFFSLWSLICLAIEFGTLFVLDSLSWLVAVDLNLGLESAMIGFGVLLIDVSACFKIICLPWSLVVVLLPVKILSFFDRPCLSRGRSGK